MNAKNINARMIVLTLGVAACTVASAQTAGTVIGKIGYNHFYPQVDSGEVQNLGVPGAKADLNDAGNLYGSMTYMISDNVSTELAIGVPPKHDLIGRGTIAALGKIGTVDVLPLALVAQYRFFDANTAFRPYVGAGVVRAMFRNEKATDSLKAALGPDTTFSIDSAWGSMLQAGFTYAINDKWFFDASVAPFFIKSTARTSSGQSVKLRVNPVGVNMAIGYRF